MNTPAPEPQISVVASPDGAALVYQGFYQQAFFLTRENVPRFLRTPEETAMLVIPPLAALGLHCYVVAGEAHAFHLDADPLSETTDHVLTIHVKTGERIRYYTCHENCATAQQLVASRIRVVITPQRIAVIEVQHGPRLATVLEMPSPERVSYRHRFAHETTSLTAAVAHALKTQTRKLP